jgi:hypothetical protein
LWDLEELEDHRLICAKDLAGRDGEEEAVPDVTCGACHGDAEWTFC